ncbi:hypothetical protein HPP92_022756 [Vanilla planifolia]|uniref:TF-B3 domain-containing protein n=1 Tax=Vanilla planifolia TaxID=51239 RepID=A0A835PVB8_VANPL|nr:hypothetical protein HPP92_022756 [Vanilla planifolia]
MYVHASQHHRLPPALEHFLPSPSEKTLPLRFEMPANPFAFQAQQAWILDAPMDSFHYLHHRHSQELHFQAEQQQLGGDMMMSCEKEPMFEKPLTPSDVGKLNRLVIPKQHAEKYFPLDGEAGEKGLLLSFEDEGGKTWRFRYSYWTSSQSYVLTKGWSRFVKEKQLDAGDAVLFLRRRTDAERLYIGCRRRSGSQEPTAASFAAQQGITTTPQNAPMQWTSSSVCNPPSPSRVCLNSIPKEEQSSAAAVAIPGNSKRLRLFGVNLECGHLFPGSSVMTFHASSHQL